MYLYIKCRWGLCLYGYIPILRTHDVHIILHVDTKPCVYEFDTKQKIKKNHRIKNKP